ncbi:MAG: GGDEF domain-containing response regulator [Calditrichaeota bacterium]|jgi:two-component system, cell cycle response regulator|nr:GGDEF domain-containing response regulator [Calditrichota bacterium]MBT7617755.1 GGDEF domain-containing response regulator [Calditrichota bacterium]MBT7789525.1 GGDEF domain-containing response regulator [Calditrichota bacterium]
MVDQKKNYIILTAIPKLGQTNEGLSLSQNDDYLLVNAKDSEELTQIIFTNRADLVLVEYSLPGLNLLDIVIKVRSSDPDVPILVINDQDDRTLDKQIWSYGIDDLFRSPVSSIELTHRVARALKMRKLVTLYSVLKRENRGLRKLSQTDGLTQLINRRSFTGILESEYERVSRFGGEMGCLMIDIDYFKRVNDTFGHLTGDRILREMANDFKEKLRAIDVIARYGGEEFIALLPETSTAGILVVAEKLRSSIEARDFRDHDSPYGVGPESLTISIGAALFPADGVTNTEGLIRVADQALYMAKDAGRNTVVMLPPLKEE